jgi:DNA-binding MarR family transcriptional regulator
MTMSEVSQMMMISKQQATQVTDRMVEAGYIRREADKQDRRIIKVTITQKGYDSLTECGEMIRQKTREKLDRLTDQDIEDLDRALNILYSLMLKLRGEAPAEKIL